MSSSFIATAGRVQPQLLRKALEKVEVSNQQLEVVIYN